MSTTKSAAERDSMTESEALRVDLEQTRAHLADTVQELSRRLNVPNRVKESAGQAGSRVKETAGAAGGRVKETAGVAGTRVKESAGQAMKDVPAMVKDLPATSKQHPKATAAVGGALAVVVGAVAWLARRRK